MRCRLFQFVVMSLSLGMCYSGGVSAQTVEQAVQSFFPQRLIDESVEIRANGSMFEPVQHSTFVTADLNGNGTLYTVAAYSNGFGGAVRILHQTTNGFVLVAD